MYFGFDTICSYLLLEGNETIKKYTLLFKLIEKKIKQFLTMNYTKYLMHIYISNIYDLYF